MKRLFPALFLALLLGIAFVGRASAHANVERSNPTAGSTLPTAPATIEIEFSEEADPSFTRVELVNSSRQVVNAGPGALDPANPRILKLAPGDLPDGSYTAMWRARSAVDGHITQGNIPFGIGAAASVALIAAPGTPEPATDTPPALDSASRWSLFLLAAIAFGGLPFGLLVWRPALRTARKSEADVAAMDAAISSTIRRLIMVGSALFLLANIVFLILQAANAAGVSPLEAIGSPVLDLLGGRSGQFWLARIALTLVIIAIAWRLPVLSAGRTVLWWVGLALSIGVLATFSLTSHSAAIATGAEIAIAVDLIHLCAMVAWIGGLIPLLITVLLIRRDPRKPVTLGLIIPRFSRLAVVSVVVLALSGTYSYLVQIGSLDLLGETTYGWALVIKVALFALLVLFGALNLFLLSPRLRAKGNDLARAFGQSVRIELVIGALVLLAVGVMTSIAPSKIAWEAQQKLGYKQEADFDGGNMVLRVAPLQIGDNEFAVDVSDNRVGAAAVPAEVLLRFTVPGATNDPFQVAAQPTEGPRYSARGSYLSVSGRWQVEAILRRSGFNDVRHIFPLDVPVSTANGDTPIVAAPPVTATISQDGIEAALTTIADPSGDTFTLRLRGSSAAPDQVALEVLPQDIEAGTTIITLNKSGDEDGATVYAATEPVLSLSGGYLARIVVPDAGGKETRLAFRLDLSDAGTLSIKQTQYIRAVLSTSPSPVMSGTVQLNINLLDAQDAPVEGATISLTALMPAHGHVDPDIAAAPVTGQPGFYRAEAVVQMGGTWLLIVDVNRDDQEPMKIDTSFEVIDPEATPTPP